MPKFNNAAAFWVKDRELSMQRTKPLTSRTLRRYALSRLKVSVLSFSKVSKETALEGTPESVRGSTRTFSNLKVFEEPVSGKVTEYPVLLTEPKTMETARSVPARRE